MDHTQIPSTHEKKMEGEAELVLDLGRLRELEEKLNECERTHDPAVALYVKVCVCDL